MANQRLQHDAAAAIATKSLHVVSHLVHPGLHKEAWDLFYKVAKWGIEDYVIQVERTEHRLNPTKQ
jgi:hypothetical protein